MSKIYLAVNKISIFLLFLLMIITKQQSQVKIYSNSSDGVPYIDPFDDDTEINTTDKNCNMREYPEHAIKCNNVTMKCLDEERKHHCSCIKGYITYVNDTKNVKYCNFRQKKTIDSFYIGILCRIWCGAFL